jgi:hypothetical protein
MSKRREIRCYDYVNHPYERVRDPLRQDALTVFQAATMAAASRAQSIAAELHVDRGGIGVKTDIKISVKKVEEKSLMPCRLPPPDCCSNGRPRPCHVCSRSWRLNVHYVHYHHHCCPFACSPLSVLMAASLNHSSALSETRDGLVSRILESYITIHLYYTLCIISHRARRWNQ